MFQIIWKLIANFGRRRAFNCSPRAGPLHSLFVKNAPLCRFRLADPVARHAEWVSSPALKTLLPRLHQNARDLLADLAAARGAGTPAAATPYVSSITGSGDERQWEYTRSAAAREIPLGETGSRTDGNDDGEEPVVSVDSAATRHLVGDDGAEKQLASLRKECKTLRIVVDALREKDEDNQVGAQEFAVFQMPPTLCTSNAASATYLLLSREPGESFACPKPHGGHMW